MDTLTLNDGEVKSNGIYPDDEVIIIPSHLDRMYLSRSDVIRLQSYLSAWLEVSWLAESER